MIFFVCCPTVSHLLTESWPFTYLPQWMLINNTSSSTLIISLVKFNSGGDGCSDIYPRPGSTWESNLTSLASRSLCEIQKSLLIQCTQIKKHQLPLSMCFLYFFKPFLIKGFTSILWSGCRSPQILLSVATKNVKMSAFDLSFPGYCRSTDPYTLDLKYSVLIRVKDWFNAIRQTII